MSRESRSKRPRVITRCVADRYASQGERIVEFTFPDGTGGLISLHSHGRNVLSVYRVDPDIIITTPTKEG